MGEKEVESEVDEVYVSDPGNALPEMHHRDASNDEGLWKVGALLGRGPTLSTTTPKVP